MIWSDEMLREATRRIVFEKQTYPRVAADMTAELGQGYIHPEQLRGAVRRYAARMIRQNQLQAAPEPVVDAMPHDGIDINVGKVFRFGAIGDTHLGSRYEQLDTLNAIYDVYADQGVQHVFHTGNHIDGEARFNEQDIHVHGMNNQVEYFVRNYPHRPNMFTHFVTGDDHEGWYTQREGIDIGWYTEQKARQVGRIDLQYIGHMERDLRLTNRTTMRVMHPGMGAAKAISWAAQGIVDMLEQYERPQVILAGHYHKAHFLPDYRGVHIIQTASVMSQTPWMRKKRIRSDIGAWVITITFTDEGSIARIGAEYLNYNQGRWQYK